MGVRYSPATVYFGLSPLCLSDDPVVAVENKKGTIARAQKNSLPTDLIRGS